MIRFRRLTASNLANWLVEQHLNGTNDQYRLRLWKEQPEALASLESELRSYVDEAFDDARKKIRAGFEDSLSPFNDAPTDPAANYPSLLHAQTLRGYFGEILAVIAIEHLNVLNYDDWKVPAFLFRFHDQEFQHLELINEKIRSGELHNPDARNELRPGRTGDDGLAFRVNDDHVITDVLTVEAKCLVQNQGQKIQEAHEKLSKGGPLPPGIRELVNLLSEYETPDASAWVESLMKLRESGYRTATRWDAITYACGHGPVRGERVTWLPLEHPHTSYTVPRFLAGLEFHFNDLPGLIGRVYRGV